MKKKTFGRYIVADPLICHGRLTFRGTRVLVEGVLQLVEEGRDWDEIIQGFHGSITGPAIAEAVRLANRALSKQAGENRTTAKKVAKSA